MLGSACTRSAVVRAQGLAAIFRLEQAAAELFVLELAVVLGQYPDHIVHFMRMVDCHAVLDEVLIKHVGGLKGKLLNGFALLLLHGLEHVGAFGERHGLLLGD